MIDRRFVGHAFPPFVYDVEPFQLRLFAKAVGGQAGVYTDSEAAHAAGYSALLAPPTFPFCISTNSADPLDIFTPLGVPVAHILHGSQSFTYHQPICAGMRIRVERRIADIASKKNGALEFITYEMRYIDTAPETLMCEAEQVIIHRKPEASR